MLGYLLSESALLAFLELSIALMVGFSIHAYVFSKHSLHPLTRTERIANFTATSGTMFMVIAFAILYATSRGAKVSVAFAVFMTGVSLAWGALWVFIGNKVAPKTDDEAVERLKARLSRKYKS